MELKDKLQKTVKDEIEKLDDGKNYTLPDLLSLKLILNSKYEPVKYDRIYSMVQTGDLPFVDVSPSESGRTDYLIRGEKLKSALYDYYNLN